MIQGVETGDVWDSHGGMSSRCLCHHSSLHYFQVLLRNISYHHPHSSQHHDDVLLYSLPPLLSSLFSGLCWKYYHPHSPQHQLFRSSRWWWLLNWVRDIVMLLQMINDKHFFELCFSTTWSKLPKNIELTKLEWETGPNIE